MTPQPSPFLDPGPSASSQSLAIIHLKRDLLMPTILQASASTAEYAEGEVTNTRFGSFPHSTLVGLTWGSQVLASVVDTGSRGSKGGKASKKRKRDADDSKGPFADGEDTGERQLKAAVAASTGFAHLLPPTPESWTASLPHRTQVVYTPDYSYVLQRLVVRPGDTIIEAGAGSGSFSHAAARAAFSGFAGQEQDSMKDGKPQKKRRLGKVYSYEFHEQRFNQLRKEIQEHKLDYVIKITHRDVYQDGFCLENEDGSEQEPQADAVFLDLPAPWLALKHLTRSQVAASTLKAIDPSSPGEPQEEATPAISQPAKPFRSPLNPKTATRICTFSPCIEQVIKTVAVLRQLGWMEIDMVEMQHRRIDVRRERVGIGELGLRGGNASPSTVEESLHKLKEHGKRHEAYQEVRRKNAERAKRKLNGTEDAKLVDNADIETVAKAKARKVEENVKRAEERYIFNEGKLVHRTEHELKTHTSYLVFAVLPRSWTEEDEAKCRQKWPITSNSDKSSKMKLRK